MVAQSELLATEHLPLPRLDQPYHFVPPYQPRFWTGVMQPFLPAYLRRSWGVEHVAFRNVERLHASLAAGHGIVLAPNHTRHCDPFVIGCLQDAAVRVRPDGQVPHLPPIQRHGPNRRADRRKRAARPQWVKRLGAKGRRRATRDNAAFMSFRSVLPSGRHLERQAATHLPPKPYFRFRYPSTAR